MSAPITIQIVWSGIAVQITHHKSRWHKDFDHIEILSEDRRALPVTETGYLSHHVAAASVEEYGGAESYVRTFLDHEAAKPGWKEREAASRQMSLF